MEVRQRPHRAVVSAACRRGLHCLTLRAARGCDGAVGPQVGAAGTVPFGGSDYGGIGTGCNGNQHGNGYNV